MFDGTETAAFLIWEVKPYVSPWEISWLLDKSEASLHQSNQMP
jgi:hypothetical protein